MKLVEDEKPAEETPAEEKKPAPRVWVPNPQPGQKVYELDWHNREVNELILEKEKEPILLREGFLYVCAINMKNAQRKFKKMVDERIINFFNNEKHSNRSDSNAPGEV